MQHQITTCCRIPRREDSNPVVSRQQQQGGASCPSIPSFLVFTNRFSSRVLSLIEHNMSAVSGGDDFRDATQVS